MIAAIAVRHPAQTYTYGVIAAGALMLAARLPEARFDRPLLFLALLLAAMILSASKVRLPVAGGTATLSLSYFTDMLSLMMLGADAAMLIGGFSAVSQCYLLAQSRPNWHRTLFSAAVLIVSIQAAGLVAAALGGFHREAPLAALLTATFGAASALYLLNSLLVTVAISMTRGVSIVDSWHRELFWTAPSCVVGAASAALLFFAAGEQLWTALLAAVPLFVTAKSYRLYSSRLAEKEQHVAEMSALHLATVEALARAIDARDQTIDHVRGSSNHIRRVQAWAVMLGETAGMTGADLEALRVAALLHDIGKLAVPEHILTKPGRLTAKEFERVRVHPVIGAEIIKAVPFPYPVASFIRSHHERWDGSGYPDGLRGDHTPLGARVLAVVDYFDALTSSRHYHEPMDRAEAIATLRSEAGRTLDPSLVARFLALLPQLEKLSIDEHSHAPLVARGEPSTGLAERTAVAPVSAFHNIALATQEVRALYDIAQTLGTRLGVDDTMALLSAKLARLLPGSCWALFLHQPDEDALHCRFATGDGAAALAGTTIPCGQGPSGWAARQRTTVVNACAAADFEAARPSTEWPRFQSALSCALVDADQLVGVITIYHVEANPFSEEHRHLFEHISSHVASVIGNAVAVERLRDASFTDALTGLPNNRALREYGRQGSIATAEPGSQLACIMLDIDAFKTVNDTHGHAAGDAVLRQLASAIREHLRESDFCARFGADEFVIVMPGCDRKTAELRGLVLQTVIDGWAADARPGTLRTGVSVGVSASPDDGSRFEALIAAADKRMYIDKRRRNARLRGRTGGVLQAS
jgi:diguanylate cyclase (GGDEF)-like protein/putative nucleotidyltransferase with HDIG domain